jgi:hypothetical protein
MSPEERQRRFGPTVTQTRIKIDRAAQLAQYLVGNPDGIFATLLELRSNNELGSESIIFEIEVERPQYPAADIRRTEQVAATFQEADRSYPEVFALREDFPQVLIPTCVMRNTPRAFVSILRALRK